MTLRRACDSHRSPARATCHLADSNFSGFRYDKRGSWNHIDSTNDNAQSLAWAITLQFHAFTSLILAHCSLVPAAPRLMALFGGDSQRVESRSGCVRHAGMAEEESAFPLTISMT